MDWSSAIQQAIDYVEQHLTDQIDYEAAAKQACSSVFHFQRVFGVLCGYSLGDYIRMRRLSLAGEELAGSNAKVIDVAYKYGYETPESFSRAFTKFHGITPLEAKHGGSIRSFTRLSVRLTLAGGNKMEYRIVKKEAFQVVCKRKRVSKPETANAPKDISSFWAECGANSTVKKICGYLPAEASLKGLLGICFSSETDCMHFPYGIGVEYDGRPVADSDLEIVTVPAHTFAVFTCRGRMPEAFASTYQSIVTEFFPQSSRYAYAEGIEMELYPSEDVESRDYTCEIWIAVKEK